jgi:spermidine synthase
LIPWVHLDTARIADGQELKLMQRGAEYSIMLGPIELMNSRLSGSEEALATLSAATIGGRAQCHVLIGGLGMGFTLRAALAVLKADAKITVGELVPEVVAWGRGPMAGLFDGCLDDPRVTMQLGDVGKLIAAGDKSYDAILLDVDNGPDGLTRQSNDGLYGFAGLSAARKALRPGGVLAVWSSAPDKDFSHRLRDSGFEVEEAKVRANGSRGGARHMIWLAIQNGGVAQKPACYGKRRK